MQGCWTSPCRGRLKHLGRLYEANRQVRSSSVRLRYLEGRSCNKTCNGYSQTIASLFPSESSRRVIYCRRCTRQGCSSGTRWCLQRQIILISPERYCVRYSTGPAAARSTWRSISPFCAACKPKGNGQCMPELFEHATVSQCRPCKGHADMMG